ncbi:hypothetical protein FDO65_10185 [Nakamurella flava]|uniref:Uncharacterized protein n=1 Tax=Nakamurella flava TaxID=2576308 RepID=A0A4U6QMQ9_9ACTN|nr:hypothetical protein [Nakamurella flava]TKV61883.1 hypothetical protein FDO65_10185 [Nakamurella flava]
MPYRKVRFAPLVIDGVADPKIATGVYTVAFLKRTAFGTLGQLQDAAADEFKVVVKGVAVEADLPVVEATDKNCLVIRGYIKPKGSYPSKQTSVDYVLVPSGAASTVLRFEDLSRVDPDTLTEVSQTPTPAWMARLTAAEAAIATLSAGGVPAGTLDVGDLTDVTEPGKTAITATGATLADRQAAFRSSIDAPKTSHQHQLSQISDLSSLTIGWDKVTGEPDTFPPSTHRHSITDIDGLADVLASLGASASASAQVLKWTEGDLSTNGTSYGVYDTSRPLHEFIGARDPKIAGYTLRAGDKWREQIVTGTGGVDITIDDKELTYTSGWISGDDVLTYGSSDHYAQVAGEKATYTWTSLANGTAALICKKAPHHGIMSLRLDGGTAVSVDLYAATEAYSVEVWKSGPLSAGSHTIEITSTATKNSAAVGTVAEVDGIKLVAAAAGTSNTNPNPSTGGSSGGTTPAPTGFLTRVGDKLQVDGKNWRATGINLPWWNGCGSEIGLPPTVAQMTTLFQNATPGSIYRFFTFGGWDLAKMDQLVAAARPYGHKFILTLSDNMDGCGEPYCGPNPTAFFSGGWKTGGWRDKWLTPVVQRYKNEPVIGMYEWCNEPPPDQLFRSFLDEVGAYVRNTLGDKHLISTGCMSAYGNDTGARLLNNSPYIDVASMHEYDPNQAPSVWTTRDAANAAVAGKPFIVGESGIKDTEIAAGSPRATAIRNKILALKANFPTCVAYIYWSGGAPTGAYLSQHRHELSIIGTQEINVINTTPLL